MEDKQPLATGTTETPQAPYTTPAYASWKPNTLNGVKFVPKLNPAPLTTHFQNSFEKLKTK